VVLTHVRINNQTHQYYGEGFSFITYVSAYGAGSGWTYDKLESQYITRLTGSFTPPLWGLVFGKLDESGPTRKLSLTIVRIDVGLPPRVNVQVEVWGPWRVSPGQTFNYFMEYRNTGLKAATNTEIGMILPLNVTYINNTGNGNYNSTLHTVTWLRNIPAKSRSTVSTKCKAKWGLPYIANITLATDSFITRVTPAGDPNKKHGPEGYVIPGQQLNYKIEFENVGKGIAYGVYFIDELDIHLDDSTLQIGPVKSTADNSIIAPAGKYDPATRTITWLVGEVGPSKGGYADISINVRSNALPGTEIINYGIVYFPSVPEITRTNGIVSIVRLNQPPVADAGSDWVVTTFENIIFNGSASYDLDGAITSYVWDFGDGHTGYGKIVTHKFSDDGTYTVKLTVRDNNGASSFNEISVEVLNRPPEAKLEFVSKDVDTQEVTLSAEKSSDMDGLVVEYYFDFGDETDSGWVTSPIIKHRFSDPTKIYTVTLTVKDDDGVVSENNAELNISIDNMKPIPKLTIEPQEAFTYEDILCKGESSLDVDGQVISYYFDFGDGTNSGWITTPTTTHQYADGTKKYTISLKLKDDLGALSDFFTTEILIKNRKPVPSLIIDDSDIYVFEEVVFDASGSIDIDGGELEYYFDFGDGTNSDWTSESVIKHVYFGETQEHSIELIVKDDDGESESATILKTVTNRLPHADAGVDQEAELGQIVTFDGGKSYDPDGGALSFNWDFGDGTTSGWLDTVKTTYSYSQIGEYTVTLTVSDGTLSAIDTCNVDVRAVDDTKPDEPEPEPDTDDVPDESHDPSQDTTREDAGWLSQNIYLIAIIIFIIIIIIVVLTSFILKNRNKRVQKPFDSDELIRQMRDEIIQGDENQSTEMSDTELKTILEENYQNNEISEETYMLIEQEELLSGAEIRDKDPSGKIEK
jgi:uncharacterized repeat protein (TIGR01451 family)